MTSTAEITSAPVGLLTLDDANPRQTVDKDKLAWLTDSIRQHGIIQPLLVRKDGDRFLVVAGQRRLLAAIDAGLEHVPVYVRDTNGDAGTLGVIENLEREQLSPIEEAHAFRRAVDAGMVVGDLANTISRSEQLVKDRLALLELPASVQEKVGAGDLTLAAAAGLKNFAPLGEAIVTMAAQLVIDGKDAKSWEDPITSEMLAKDPAEVLDAVLEELDDKAPFMVEVGKNWSPTLTSISWPEGSGGAAVMEKYKQLPEHDANYKHPRADAVKITEADLDAARAYGCLLELGGENTGRGYRQRAGWITDPVWLADRLLEKLDKAIASQDRKTKAAAKKTAKAAGATVDPDADAETMRKQAVRADNAAKKAATLAARERNITLGVALYKELHAPAITLDAMRLLGEVISEYAAEDLGRRGLRFVDETAQTVETNKKGEIKTVKYPKQHGQVADLFRKRLAKASTPEQILGVLLQALVACRFADIEAAPSNDRHGRVRGLGDRAGYGRENDVILELVEKFAEPMLPPAVVEQMRDQRVEEEQLRHEETAAELASVREGMQTCPHCGNGSKLRGKKSEWEACDCTDDQIVAAITECPSCGEEFCFASCTAFAVDSAVENGE